MVGIPEFVPFDKLDNPKRQWIWGPPGSREEALGRLNLLTPEVVRQAKDEIQTGERVGLNWELKKLEYVGFGRLPYKHEIVGFPIPGVFDDAYHMNPQQSSQWDGFRHFSQKDPKGEKGVFWYGGTNESEIKDPNNHRIGIGHWALEGIAGRGVLLDYYSWAQKNGIEYSCFSTHQAKLTDLLQIAKECNIEFHPGDILFVRIGMTDEWDNKFTVEQKEAYAANTNPEHAGVEQSEAVARWLWDNQISAVASDAISWEVFPPQNPDWFLHECCLAGWGLPIGEMFDLEGLSKLCKKNNRWTFFLASAPLNEANGVSSPPNALAIF
ncbi:hypothetical protein CANCADRAFT_27057 [Tortispora caseinolytica NRRL Y-17796]|uniref:Cyclase n=1 Tax=Tortispora caseinolytica NRRL Y-17796 TaxID=767744 RepID=A0A1E4TCH4_9ASCO|nr:hypothetical protein CANCADRAFT_27057 [Tortispora caseinolytica NRRL Y-17796]